MTVHHRILAVDGVHCSCGHRMVTRNRARAFGEHLDWIHRIGAPAMTQLTSLIHELMADQYLTFDDFVERTGWSVRTCERFLSGNYDPNLRELATAGIAVGHPFELKIYDAVTGAPAPITIDDVLDEIEVLDDDYWEGDDQ